MYQKPTPNFDTTIVAIGSPIGVKAAPSPIEKQAAIVISIFFVLLSGSALTISTNINEAMIAVMTLDKSPNYALFF